MLLKIIVLLLFLQFLLYMEICIENYYVFTEIQFSSISAIVRRFREVISAIRISRERLVVRGEQKRTDIITEEFRMLACFVCVWIKHN